MTFARSFGRKDLKPAARLNEWVPPYPVPPGQAGKPYRDGWDLRRTVDNGLQRSIWVYRSVQAIASNQAKLPMIMRRDDPVDGPQVDHPILDLFNFKSSEYERSMIFRKRISQQFLLNRQGCMLEVIHSRMGTDPLALYMLPAGYTWPIPDEDVFVRGYRIQFPGKAWFDVPAENVVWIREPHPYDPYSGITPMEAAGLSVETDWYARLYQRNFLLNDGRPGGILVIHGDVEDDDAEELRRRFYGPSGWGIGGAGRVTVMEGEGADFVDTGANPRDAQYGQVREIAKTETLMAFGVPESVAGNASGRTYDNADAELEIFWREVMLDHLNSIARALDELVPEPNLYFGFDLSEVHVLERDKRQRHQYALSEVQAGVIVGDEYRLATGRKPIGLTKAYVPNTYIEVADISTAASVNPDVAGALSSDAWTGTHKAPLKQIIEQKAADSTGVMVALYPPRNLADMVAQAGGEAADELHITLVYCGNAAALTPAQRTMLHSVAAQVAASNTPVDGVLGQGSGVFHQQDVDVEWLSYDAPGLAELRTALAAALVDADLPVAADHGFTPHMTLAYAPAGEGDLSDVSPAQWRANAVSVVVGGHRVDYPFGEQPGKG